MCTSALHATKNVTYTHQPGVASAVTCFASVNSRETSAILLYSNTVWVEKQSGPHPEIFMNINTAVAPLHMRICTRDKIIVIVNTHTKGRTICMFIWMHRQHMITFNR